MKGRGLKQPHLGSGPAANHAATRGGSDVVSMQTAGRGKVAGPAGGFGRQGRAGGRSRPKPKSPDLADALAGGAGHGAAQCGLLHGQCPFEKRGDGGLLTTKVGAQDSQRIGRRQAKEGGPGAISAGPVSGRARASHRSSSHACLVARASLRRGLGPSAARRRGQGRRTSSPEHRVRRGWPGGGEFPQQGEVDRFAVQAAALALRVNHQQHGMLRSRGVRGRDAAAWPVHKQAVKCRLHRASWLATWVRRPSLLCKSCARHPAPTAAPFDQSVEVVPGLHI